jgi:SlyX protein
MDESNFNETRNIEIETKLAHQEQLLDELNQVLTDQQTQLMRLEELFAAMVERVQSLGDNSPDAEPKDETPPHY